MTAPEVAWNRFLTGLVFGCVLGIVYGFLRPLRRGKAVLPDLLFALATGWVYLYYGFAVCRGDLRIGYWAAPLVGAIAWDRSVGQWLSPLFCGFWRSFARVLLPVQVFFKKIWNFIKFLFATWKKWGILKWNNHKNPNSLSEGDPYDTEEETLQPYPAGLPPQFDPRQVCGPGCYRTVYGGTTHGR